MIKENFCYSSYEILKESKSQIDKTVTHLLSVGFRCPACKTALKSIDHGEKTICPKCHLIAIRYGNGLHCTVCEDEDPAEVYVQTR